MNDYIYMGIIVAMFVIFIILHIKQNNKIKRLMNRYEKFMKGKNAEDGAGSSKYNNNIS